MVVMEKGRSIVNNTQLLAVMCMMLVMVDIESIINSEHLETIKYHTTMMDNCIKVLFSWVYGER